MFSILFGINVVYSALKDPQIMIIFNSQFNQNVKNLAFLFLILTALCMYDVDVFLKKLVLILTMWG